MEDFYPFIWVLIPLAGILLGGFKEWLRFRAEQRELGSSTRELEATVEQQREELEAAHEAHEALVRRIQNLEAIVTTQVWDALHDGSQPWDERDRRIDEARMTLQQPEEPSDAERADVLARRLKT